MKTVKRQRRRLEDLIRTATTLFIRKGYRRTQIAEIARTMGVAPGTIYLYVSGKEGLFNLLIQYHFFGLDLDGELELPMPEPEPEQNLALLKEQLPALFKYPGFNQAKTTQNPESVRDEFKVVINEVYNILFDYRYGLRLIERSALDWPELADFFYLDLRNRLLSELQSYIELRIDGGYFNPVVNTEAAARFILASVAYYSSNSEFDPYPDSYSDEEGRETVVELTANAFCRLSR